MTNHHGGAGHTGEDRDLSSHIEDTEGMDIGPYNDNKSTKRLDTMIAFRGLEPNDYLGELLPNNQENLGTLTREIIQLPTVHRN